MVALMIIVRYDVETLDPDEIARLPSPAGLEEKIDRQGDRLLDG